MMLIGEPVMKSLNTLYHLVTLLLIISVTGEAAAQTYPSRPISMIVPFAAGGPTDVVARIVAERMAATLGQTIVIENVSGADGVIGVGRVARAAPDGYTLGVGMLGTHVLNGAVYSLPYDLLTDFEPISELSRNPYLLVGRKDLPASSIQDLIGWIRGNPEGVSMASASMTQRVSGAYFQKVIGARFQFVPYRGAGPALQDLAAGHIDLMFDQPSNSLPQLRVGNIKAFAVAAEARLASAPEIPSMNEAGLPGFSILSFNALWAPKGTPETIVSKVNAAVAKALDEPTVRSRLADLGQDIPTSQQRTPQALRSLQKIEMEKWWPLIKEANIKSE